MRIFGQFLFQKDDRSVKLSRVGGDVICLCVDGEGLMDDRYGLCL